MDELCEACHVPEAHGEQRLVDVPVRADGRQALVEDPVSVTHLGPGAYIR